MKSHRVTFFVTALIIVLICMAEASQAQTHIEITTPMTPPNWALMERELLRANSKACEEFASYYLDERGYILHTPRWGTLDGTDDAIETFVNWTMLYALGASDSVLELFKKALEGHLLQYKELTTDSTEIAKYGAYYKEFLPMSDWHHNGESIRGFLFQGLCEPENVLYQKRIRRFAGFYMNEDPDAPNYDPEHKIIRSIWNGSRGPMLRKATQYDWTGDPCHGKFHILHSSSEEMLDFEEEYPKMLAHFVEYLNSAGDHPINLIATVLSLNAYMLSHEEKYKNWIVEYVNAWKERTIANGGNIPTNIGLDGTIGGEFDGKWYGGTYGWDFSPWSSEHKVVAHRNIFDRGMWMGFGNALLVTGDQSYVDVLRRQINNLYAQKKVINGKVMIPHSYGEKGEKTEPPLCKIVNGELTCEEKKLIEPGWYNWTPNLMVDRLIDIYLWSMDRKDLERIPIEGWIAFLEGKNPDYPEKVLSGDFTYIRRKMEEMRSDPTTPDTRLADWAMGMNPASTNTLVRLMLGGHPYSKIHNFHSRLRYFDPDRNRAGIPEDVASLVSEINKEMTKVILINVNQVEPRNVIVQTGGYGEHQCLRVETASKSYQVNNRFFNVRLAPGAGAELVIYAKRYANQPTLAFPWHGDTVPMP